MSRLTASIHWFRLFLISLKSPLYESVIFGGMSPFEIRSTYSAATLSGPMTASRVAFTPSTILRKSPRCFVASARVSSFPSTAATDKRLASSTRSETESIHWFRLFLISLKSPLYESVIFGGISPFEIRSTYSAATFRGPITASSVSLIPLASRRRSPSYLSGSTRVSSWPAFAA